MPMVNMNAELSIRQDWHTYTPEEHVIWRSLFQRQTAALVGRACDEFMLGLEALKIEADAIPDFGILNERLERLTGWSIVAVPSLVPDHVFFEHLANRRFPAGRFIRTQDQIGYIKEPDVFHDVFGHVPMLAHPTYADYMQAYGRGGLRATAEFNALANLARLYWYTVEFGLVEQRGELRIYGSGIASSPAETVYALQSPKPRRLHFDLERVMRTDYKIDDLQPVYFVIRSFADLYAETYQDFGPLYERLASMQPLAPNDSVAGDQIYQRARAAI